MIGVLYCSSFLGLLAGAAGGEDGEATLDYAREIAPLFASHCFDCHGPAKAQAGLRLTSAEEMRENARSGQAAVVPGKPEQSEILRRLRTNDPDERMPAERPPLTNAEIARIERWIAEGAGVTPHWSLVPPRSPALPQSQQDVWVQNPIDRFVLARLEAAGLKPSPTAEKSELLRRLALDLTGLPPTEDARKLFLENESPDAYVQLVDHLLAAPEFGEHWARAWLDLARYADSDGYEQDFVRTHAWRWRDWVVHAIASDMPYDEFTRLQIAGDLLEGMGNAGAVATGFHRNSLLNREPGVDLEEDRVRATVERLNTVATTWLGWTVSCAECHDHKYEALTQQEYYELLAFFQDADDSFVRAPLPAEMQRVEEGRAAYNSALQLYVREFEDPAFRVWCEELRVLPDIWRLADSYAPATQSATEGANLYQQEDGSFIASGLIVDGTRADTYTGIMQTSLPSIRMLRLELLADEGLPGNGPGWGERGNVALAEVRITSAPRAEPSLVRAVGIASVLADLSPAATPIEAVLDGDGRTQWQIEQPELAWLGLPRTVVFCLADDVGHSGGTQLAVALGQYGGQGKSKLGRFRLSVSSADPTLAHGWCVPTPIVELARREATTLSDDERADLLRYYHSIKRPNAPALLEFSRAIARWQEAQGEHFAQVLRPRRSPRTTRVLRRGNWLEPIGPDLAPNTPSFLPALSPKSARATRLDLAEWLNAQENPLTDRVEVNRIWMQLFGIGLVRSPADFGSQGEVPTHPELLDWLVLEFRRLGRSRKALVREIVTSATYAQSSNQSAELLRKDPENRLFARQNRLRLSAEVIRDGLLASSGLLLHERGGPPVGAKTLCRSLYIERRRTDPPAMLAVLDTPSGNVPCVERPRSNTPLQALTLLNDELVLAAARGLCERVHKESTTILRPLDLPPGYPQRDAAENYEFLLPEPIRGKRLRIAHAPWTDEPFEHRALCLAEVELWSQGQNLARQGQARQSNMVYGGVAERAIDGNRDGRLQRGSVTHTMFGEEAWWEVELTEESSIERVQVFQRTQHKHRLERFRLSIFDAMGRECWGIDIAPKPPPDVSLAPLEERLQLAFAHVLARAPTAMELEELRRLYEQVRELYADSTVQAQELAGQGTPPGLTTEDEAAFVIVARTLYNLDEFVMRP